MTALGIPLLPNKHVSRLLAALTAVTATALLGVTLVYALEWPVQQELPESTSVESWDTIDVGLGSGDLYVSWAFSATDTTGVQVVVGELATGNWSAPTTLAAPPVGQHAWSPSLTYFGTDLSVTWVQGSESHPCANPRSVMQQDLGDSSAQAITGNVYGPAIAPDTAGGSSGWHMVFAAAPTPDQCSQGSKFDLYYAHRESPAHSWSAPTVVITHEAVLDPAASYGGIWYPRIALDDSNEILYVVWQQEQNWVTPVIRLDTAAWLVTATVASIPPTWSEPVRLSPPEQQYAVRPTLAVDGSGQVHTVWTEYIRTDYQNIHYQPLGKGPVVKLNIQPAQVSNNAPMYARSSIATQGTSVCVTWHGYTEVGPEEVSLRCSANQGDSWQLPVNVSESSRPLSVYPEIAMDQDGDAHIVWAEFRLDDDLWVPEGVYYRAGQPPDDLRVFLPLVMRGR